MIYFYDGSKEAFFTAFLLSYGDEEAVLASRNCQLALGQEAAFVKTDPIRAKRAEERFGKLDKGCLKDLDAMLRSGDKSRDMVLLAYFRCIAQQGGPVRDMLHEDAVIAARECIARVGTEVHRMKGFVRFMESASGALYAPIAPDHDICDLLVPHFRARLGALPFVIHDVGRSKAAVSDGKTSFVAPLASAEVLLSADEAAWQSLWKQYYASVNIPSRERLRQMRGYMPVRYWRFMPEKH